MVAPKTEPLGGNQITWAMLGFAVMGWLLRAAPLAAPIGGFAIRPDYDEGVYFSAAAFLLKGVLPYRDFAFVHPPGGLLAFAAIAATAKSSLVTGFVACRWAMTFVGAANVFLTGALAKRSAGPLAGFMAAALYALLPETVSAERSVLLEGLLNLACLGGAWLSLNEEPVPKRLFAGGVLLGAACGIKLWAIIWVAGIAVAVAGRRSFPLTRWLIGLVVGAALLLAPLAVVAPGAFFKDALVFQLQRPPDHVVAFGERVASVLSHAHAAGWLLAVLGLASVAWRRGRASAGERTAALVYAMTLAAFLSAGSFWSQYLAFLAPPECLLAGVALCAAWNIASTTTAWNYLAVGAIAVGAMALAAREAWRVNERAVDPDWVRASTALAEQVPPDATFFSLEPGWGLGLERLPSGPKPWVDPYAEMLLAAGRAGNPPTARAAFQTPASIDAVAPRLQAARFVALGIRGQWQLAATTCDWIRAHRLQRLDGNPDLWELPAPP